MLCPRHSVVYHERSVQKTKFILSEDNDIDEILDVSGEETEINSDDEDNVFYSFFQQER